MRRRIIDMHQHLGSGNPPDAMAEEYAALGVEKVVLLAEPPRRAPGANEAILAAHRKYPQLYVPFVGFDLDDARPEELARYRDQGFVGIKFIGPQRAYNDPAYFPVYEKAADLGMPALFHLGIVANVASYADCDSNLMRPIHLDHIARRNPRLKIIGAHFGNPWFEEAAMSCRWNPNLFFDLSGSTLKYRTPEYLGSLLWWTPATAYRSPDGAWAWEKILFGSDVNYHQVRDVMRDYEQLMTALGLAPELQEGVWYGNAAKLLGVCP